MSCTEPLDFKHSKYAEYVLTLNDILERCRIILDYKLSHESDDDLWDSCMYITNNAQCAIGHLIEKKITVKNKENIVDAMIYIALGFFLIEIMKLSRRHMPKELKKKRLGKLAKIKNKIQNWSNGLQMKILELSFTTALLIPEYERIGKNITPVCVNPGDFASKGGFFPDKNGFFWNGSLKQFVNIIKQMTEYKLDNGNYLLEIKNTNMLADFLRIFFRDVDGKTPSKETLQRYLRALKSINHRYSASKEKIKIQINP